MSERTENVVERLFHDALEQPPQARESFVRQHAPDQHVEAEVLALIAADATPDPLLGATPDALANAAGIATAGQDVGSAAAPPGPAVRTATSRNSLVGRTVGPYRVLERIGHGGMGTVYRAQRVDLGNHVALKVVRGALGDPARIARFHQEQRVLARLGHPRIALLLDAGVAEDDTPYLVMEYVEGEALTAWCDARNLGIRERLELFLEVCEAVGFAHRNLVVHRDIKPSNVLIGADGHVKLLDFGIAKLLEAADDEPALTATGARLLSPEYAAPEQLRGEPVTTATDVHGLGLLLHDLLANVVGVDASGTTTAPTVLTETTPRIHAARRVRARLTPDLAAICECATADEPARRYASVDLLRDDVQRFLDGRPVVARRATLAYRVGKFVRRNALAVSAAAMLILLLVAGVVGVLWQARKATLARETSDELATFLVGMFEASDPAEAMGTELTARDLLERGSVRAHELDDRPEVQARLLDAMARAWLGIGDYDRADSHALQALTQERALHGAQDADIAAVLNTLGHIRYEQGRQAEAADFMRDALAMRRDVLGDEHDLTTGAMLDLVQVLHRPGGYDEAEALAREALAVRQTRYGAGHEYVVEALAALGQILWYSNRDIEQADSLIRAAYDMSERLFGPDDLRTAGYMTLLSGFLPVRGQAEEAETYARRALEIHRRVYGDDHPTVVHQLNNVASALQGQGEIPRARALFHEMIEQYEQTLTDDHPLHAIALNNLSSTFYAEGTLDSAEHYLRQSVEMHERMADGALDADVALGYHNLGSLQRAQGRLAQAEASLGESYRQRIELYGADNPATLRTGAAYADVIAERGRIGEAEPMLRHILELQQSAGLAETTPDAARTMGYLAGALVQRGAYDEAEQLYRAALTVAEQHMPEGHPRRTELEDGLAELLRSAP